MLQPDDAIGRYHIQRRLGHGGMGTLYLAQDPVLARQVALKLFLGDIDLPGARERFVREARAAAALSHPNIITVYDYGDYESQPYIIMEYVQGETIADIIRRKADLTVPVKLRWMEELCAGVSYAHARGIIHRDIKPANLMIDSYGRVKVLDFGIARMRGTLASNATAVMGTPGYAAPEQILGGEIDHRSDVFSIGVVCYELLAYVEAFSGETMHAITHRILNEEPLALLDVCPRLDEELGQLVMKALHKPADERFPTTEAFREELASVRRRLEAEADATTSHYVVPQHIGPPAGETAERSGVRHSPKPAERRTPASDASRTDRDLLARQRVTQIEQWLQIAADGLAQGQLEEAHEACPHILALDDKHPQVLELRRAIDAARGEREAAALIADARAALDRGDVLHVEDVLDRMTGSDRNKPDVIRLERDLRIVRVDQERTRRRTRALAAAIKAAEEALAHDDLDEALAQAREALDLDPQSERARRLEEDVLGRLGATQVRPVPAAPAAGRVTPPRSDPAPPVEMTVLRLTPAPVTAATSRSRRTPDSPAMAEGHLPAAAATFPRLIAFWLAMPLAHRRGVLAASVGVLILSVTLAAWLLTNTNTAAAPPQPSLVVIDALPWAIVTSVQGDNGARVAVDGEASTPLALRLAPGTYTVILQAPPPGSEVRTVSVRVEEGKPVTLPPVTFTQMTTEEYFRAYLQTTDTRDAGGDTPSAEPSQ